MRLLASWGNQLADPFAWLITGHCYVFSMAASPSRIPFRHGPACLLDAAELKLNAPVGSSVCRCATASLLSSAMTSTRAAMSVAIASASRCASCPVFSAVCTEPRINACHCGDDTSIFSTAQLSAWVLIPQRAGNSTCIFRRGLRLFARWEHREQAMPFRQHTTNTRKAIHQQYKLFQLMQAAHVSRNATNITYTAGWYKGNQYIEDFVWLTSSDNVHARLFL